MTDLLVIVADEISMIPLRTEKHAVKPRISFHSGISTDQNTQVKRDQCCNIQTDRKDVLGINDLKTADRSVPRHFRTSACGVVPPRSPSSIINLFSNGMVDH